MSNPLIDKYFELYPEKKEKPKPEPKPKAEIVKPSQEQSDILKEYLKYLQYQQSSNLSCVPPQSVATSNTGITAVNPSRTFTSYDPPSVNDSFLQIAEKIQKGDARVTSVILNTENFTKSYTFEVQVFT